MISVSENQVEKDVSDGKMSADHSINLLAMKNDADTLKEMATLSVEDKVKW